MAWIVEGFDCSCQSEIYGVLVMLFSSHRHSITPDGLTFTAITILRLCHHSYFLRATEGRCDNNRQL